MATVVWSGRAIAAPMAAGMPKPIVPMPPDERKWRGRLWRKNWADHIWCCPTSVTITARPFVTLSTASMTACGMITFGCIGL